LPRQYCAARPPDLIVRTRWLADKSWTELVLDEEVRVAVRVAGRTSSGSAGAPS
jgi:hypothetical protein